MKDCLFCKIIRKELNAEIVYEDDEVLAFSDIAPQAPVHILVIPKSHVSMLSEVKDYSILPDLFRAVNKIAVEKGIDKGGFRAVINNGRAAGMAVEHLHVHILGGRSFHWPPG